MKKTHRIGGSELAVQRQEVAGSQIITLEISFNSSLDKGFSVLNMTENEFLGLLEFLQEQTRTHRKPKRPKNPRRPKRTAKSPHKAPTRPQKGRKR